jgi:hypothetical protein
MANHELPGRTGRLYNRNRRRRVVAEKVSTWAWVALGLALLSKDRAKASESQAPGDLPDARSPERIAREIAANPFRNPDGTWAQKAPPPHTP